MEWLFCYGSLLNKKVRRQVIGREVKNVEDHLPGFSTEVILIEGTAYLRAINLLNNELEGERLFVSREELEQIDCYEGKEYERRIVSLKSGTRAWMYC